MPLKPKSYRFDEVTIEMLRRMAEYRGASETAALVQLIREAFRSQEKDIERYEKKKGKECN